jgi:hypothetical protein
MKLLLSTSRLRWLKFGVEINHLRREDGAS